MKKIILLVDVKDANFLIVKKNQSYSLPVLKNLEELNDIEKKTFEEYKIQIKDILIIENNVKYLLVKCRMIEGYNEEIHTKGIINDIYNLISNKEQRKILFDMTFKISLEIINDSFWLGIILSVEDKIKDNNLKYLLSTFLLFFSSIFCEEILNYKFGGIIDVNEVSANQIKKLRNKYLKHCPSSNSKTINEIISSMGINFNNYVFDIILYLYNDELLDINSRTWEEQNEKSYNLYNRIIMSPRNWIKNLLPQHIETFNKIREVYVKEFIERFDKISIERKSYATYKIFANDMTEDDKVYILQRIGLLKTLLFISNLFSNGNYTTIGGEIELNFDKFLMKTKASIIELLWNDSKNSKSSFFKKIITNYPSKIEAEFFIINRKCRDNLHYGFYNELTKEEIEILIKNQDIYLNYIVSEFDKKIKLNFGIWYSLSLCIAKLQYWASK